MLPTNPLHYRLAIAADIENIIRVLPSLLTHQHLDWENLSSQISAHSVFLCTQNNRITGVLSLAGNQTDGLWVKIFAVRSETQKFILWEKLLGFAAENGKSTSFFTIVLWDWYRNLVNEIEEFSWYENIILLETDLANYKKQTIEKKIEIRVITTNMFTDIEKIDQRAFSSPWKLGQTNLHSAIQQSSIATAVIDEGEVRGYLIADFEATTAHLSRIAIDPFYHKRGYATALLSDAIEKAAKNRVKLMTVNTQESNLASTSLYHRFGFTTTSEVIPVYQHIPTNPGS